MRKQERGIDQSNISADLARLILGKLYELNREGKVTLKRMEEYERHVEYLKRQIRKPSA